MNRKNTLFSSEHFSRNPPSLAIELLDWDMGQSLHGISHREYSDNGFRISHANLEDGCSYHTLITEKLWLSGKEERSRCRRTLQTILVNYLTENGFCRRPGKVLFCGLGNPKITADAIGPMIADSLHTGGADPLLRSAGFAEMYILKPGVPSQSGMRTGETIRLLAEHLGVDTIITADAVAARTAKRLASVIQVSDRGVWAGSGAGDYADEISRHTMPCPVISIGIPTVIRASVLADREDSEDTEGFLVSRSEVDVICRCYADLVSSAVNKIFSSPLFE